MPLPLQKLDTVLSALLIALTVIVLLALLLPLIRHAREHAQSKVRESLLQGRKVKSESVCVVSKSVEALDDAEPVELSTSNVNN